MQENMHQLRFAAILKPLSEFLFFLAAIDNKIENIVIS